MSPADRFVEAVGEFWKNPDCDLHGAADLLTRPEEAPGGLASIDIWQLENGLYSVALNAGLYDNTTPDEYAHVTVSRGRVQQAVEMFAQLSREGLK